MYARPLLTNSAVIAMTGLLTGIVVVIAMSASMKWAALIAIALLGLLPLLFVRPVEYYLLPIYFVLITVEVIGKSIDKYFVDGARMFEIHGTPPSGEVGIFIYPSDLVFLTMLALWLIPVIHSRKKIDLHPFGYAFLLYLGWIAIVSLLKSEIFYLSVAEMIRQTKFFFIFVFAANFMRDRQFLRWMMFIGLLCLFIQSAITTAAFFSGYEGHPMSFLLGGASSNVGGYELDTVIDEDDMSGTRAGGTFGNPIQTAIYLEFFIPLAFVMFFMEKNLLLRFLAGLLFAAGCVAFWATLSRAALASLAVGMGAGVLLLYGRQAIGMKAMLLMTCVGLVLAGPLAYKFIDNMSKRPTNLEGRFVIFEKAAVMILEDPLLGVGLNNNTAVKRQRFRPDPRYPGEDSFPVHNHYMVAWSETGPLGLLLQLILFYLAFTQAWKLSRSDDRLVKMFAIAAFTSFLSLYINLSGDHFSGNAQRSLFFFFAGTVMAMQGVQKSSSPPVRESPREVPDGVGATTTAYDALGRLL